MFLTFLVRAMVQFLVCVFFLFPVGGRSVFVSSRMVLNFVLLFYLLFSTGIFRLTNAGMLEVSTCKKKGFHPHTKDPKLFSVSRHHG